MATKEWQYYAQSFASLSEGATYTNVILYPVSKEQLTELMNVNKQLEPAKKEKEGKIAAACKSVLDEIKANEKGIKFAKIIFVKGTPEIDFGKQKVPIDVRDYYNTKLANLTKGIGAYEDALIKTKNEYLATINYKVFQADEKVASSINGKSLTQQEVNEHVKSGKLRPDNVLRA